MPKDHHKPCLSGNNYNKISIRLEIEPRQNYRTTSYYNTKHYQIIHRVAIIFPLDPQSRLSSWKSKDHIILHLIACLMLMPMSKRRSKIAFRAKNHIVVFPFWIEGKYKKCQDSNNSERDWCRIDLNTLKLIEIDKIKLYSLQKNDSSKLQL